MTISLGLDIGTNSIGSAWVDTERKLIDCGVSVFSAGIEEKDDERGEPINRHRNQKRQLRRMIQRRKLRRQRLLKELIQRGLLPNDQIEQQKLFSYQTGTNDKKQRIEITPWHLRRDGLSRELTPYEFGRILVHLNQRRGAFGVHIEQEDEADQGSPEGKVKDSIKNLQQKLSGRTFGQFIAEEYDQAKNPVLDQSAKPKADKYFYDPVRNRHESYRFCASREMLREEFDKLWNKQKSFSGLLASLLTDEFRQILDSPESKDPKISRIWRHIGLIFGQRRHYWNVGTLGRCILEPTDRCAPIADMHASYFRVLETINNIRIRKRGEQDRPLTGEERQAVIKKLRTEKAGNITAIRESLGIGKTTARKRKNDSEAFYHLNIENDKDREINTDWFYREIVCSVFGETKWQSLGCQQEAVNRALLRFDPEVIDDSEKLKSLAIKWWGLDEVNALKLCAAWKNRPKLEKRLKLSRKAILNLLPYMEAGKNVTEAKIAFAEDPNSNATLEQRVRYAHWVTDKLRDVLFQKTDGDVERVNILLSLRGLTHSDRHYLKKHPDLLPPAPELSNPVARKAIHEVRRHVIAYLRKYKQPPDRIIIELGREVTQPKKRRDEALKLNRDRNTIRKKIISDPAFGLAKQSKTQQNKALDRVLLARQQKSICAYSDKVISDRNAAEGVGESGPLEIDHIIPRGCGGGDGLNNLVLCYVNSNRNKGKRSPKQWLDKEQFEALESRFAHLEKVTNRDPSGYFTKRDCIAKWQILHREAMLQDEWRPSQLSDNSYIAKEIVSYLQSALYPDIAIVPEGDPGQRIYTTIGRHTAKLRRDWRLFQNLRVKEDAGEVTDEQQAANELMLLKDRADHRHHAIDAVAIAFTGPEIRTRLFTDAKSYEEIRLNAKERGQDRDSIPKPRPMPPPVPWKSIGEFRSAVLLRMYSEFDETDESGYPLGRKVNVEPNQNLPWGISHRPVKRRLVGAFHQDTLFGPVLDDQTKFTCRINVEELKPGYLKLSGEQRDAIKDGHNPWSAQEPNIDRNSYLVRDLTLRLAIRKILENNNLNPDNFTKNQIQTFSREGKIRLPSGVPIKSVVCLKTIADPVCISLKDNLDVRTKRFYIGGNNHHIEIRQDKTGKWKGAVISAFDAANRLKVQLNKIKEARKTGLTKTEKARIINDNPIVNRSDNTDGSFVMSLAEGETFWMKHPKSGIAGYFVVFKIDPSGELHFVHHTDARRAKGEKDQEGKVLTGSNREDVGGGIMPSSLKNLGIEPYKYPVKVRIDPLGQPKVMEKD
jgi:CRISPR-associated endonuclease Csn1